MRLESALEAKQEIFRRAFAFDGLPAIDVAEAGLRRAVWLDKAGLDVARQGAEYRSRKMEIAVGIAPPAREGQSEDYKIAVFLQNKKLQQSEYVDSITEIAHSEVDIRIAGRIRRLSRPWYQDVCRPLRPGCSIAHYRITAGTLGCFVKTRDDGSLCLLSNNHVLAWTNRGRLGDPIIQPGKSDGGSKADHQIGTLHKFAEIKMDGLDINYTDCAIAVPFPGIEKDHFNFDELGTLRGVAEDVPRTGSVVKKVGRTTGATTGRVTAIEVDQVMVAMSSQGFSEIARFDGQIAIEGYGAGAFSKSGDSGSLIVDSDGQAVGLLFAGSRDGGSNGRGLTFANPIRDVEAALDVQIYVR